MLGGAIMCIQGRWRKMQIISHISKVFLTDRKILTSLEIGQNIRGAWTIQIPPYCTSTVSMRHLKPVTAGNNAIKRNH